MYSSLATAAVAVFDGETPRWKDEGGRLLKLVREHRDAGSGYQSVGTFHSQDSELELRREILEAAPSLQAFVAELNKLLEAGSGVVVPEVGLGQLDKDARAILAYAMALCIGTPTATDAKQVIWDVHAKQLKAGYYSTFSETDLEAAFHTDTQYFPQPEEAFILYTVQEARCGGGWSQVLDARALKAELELTSKWLVETLETSPLPFRVPSAFATGRTADEVQATVATVFSDQPFIRYRYDTLMDGLRHFPKFGTPDVHRALDAFEESLKACAHAAEFFMPTDSMVLLDNHRGLHARSSFQDHERHLLRIRMRRGNVGSSTTTSARLTSSTRFDAHY